MIELHKLNNFLEKKKKKRIGRGQGSGKGGTSTRGHKGAKSRSGNVKKIGFEGGQLPLQRSIPKIGFTNIKKKKIISINLGFLQKIIKRNKNENIEIIDRKFYLENNIIRNKNRNKNIFVKILNKGFFNLKLKIFANKFSKNSIITIKKFGGESILL